MSTTEEARSSGEGTATEAGDSRAGAEATSRTGSYDFKDLERRWRNRWLQEKTFKTHGPGDDLFDSSKPKCYVLDMFPYPSGDGLHIGHPKGYIASDIYSRFMRMKGFNVLHPMGFDSFGLPAEQFALENNIHPAESTEQNIEIYRNQLQFLGLSFDWDREVATSREEYYVWTQWIFLQLFNSWYDPDYEWTSPSGRTQSGRARPVGELEGKFASGTRTLSAVDLEAIGDPAAIGDPSVATWQGLTEADQAAVLNSYRLAYQKEATVNWCPGLGTVLANEEVTNEGKSERGDFPVYKRPLKQWMMRITAYADRLIEDLDADDLADGRGGGTFKLDWPEPIKLMQRNWIGRSEGAEVSFELLRPGTDDVATDLVVFTTRPDTLFGATFMVVAPQHPIVQPESEQYLVPEEWPSGIDSRWKESLDRQGSGQLAVTETVAAYVRDVGALEAQRAAEQAETEKTGVFTGIMARNPVNGAVIPVFVADYVSMEYGSGAIMAVPAHDQRDHEFAEKYGIEIVQVVQPIDGIPSSEEVCFDGDGISINSPPPDGTTDPPGFAISGLKTDEAKKKITRDLEEQGKGRSAVNYKLRDWIFSRQRYWGEPFPLAERAEGFSVETELPALLPEIDDFRPETSDDPNMEINPPLVRAPDEWKRVDIDGHECRRELSIMPQWAGSCWYFLRFVDPTNSDAFCDGAKASYFMPVDLYIGGAEHAVLHLLYSRFWQKALFDLGHVGTPEPFKKYFNQGMITADAFTDERGVYVDIRDVEIRDDIPHQKSTGKPLTRSGGKMGKRYKNGLPPDEVGEEYGVDTLRLYEMYMGPLEASAPWSMEGIRGMQRFLHRVWRNFVDQDRRPKVGGEASDKLLKLLHRTIGKVTRDVDALRLNTAIASLIELNNELVGHSLIPAEVAKNFLLLLSPFAPHISEEVWQIAGLGDGDLSWHAWPQIDATYLVEEMMTLPVQINGKMRGSVEVAKGMTEQDLRRTIMELENIRRHIPDPEAIKRFIVVPGKIVNIVI